MDKKITCIPATKKENDDIRFKKVALYCRVSSSKRAQLRSLANQISGLTQLVHRNPLWNLVDIFIDIDSGANVSREGYNHMLYAASNGIMDIVIVKSSSRLGRDTADVIANCRKLKEYGCDVYFQNAATFFSDEAATLITEISAGVDQEDNYNRANSIRWGIMRGLEDGSSNLFTRPCYGFRRGDDGELHIFEDEAEIVRMIFSRYLSGASILKLKQELEDRGVPSPRGSEQWAKKTIQIILNNPKYSGKAVINYSEQCDDGQIAHGYVLSPENNPAIIPADAFEAVQNIMRERSNVETKKDGTKVRKSTHYSSKK